MGYTSREEPLKTTFCFFSGWNQCLRAGIPITRKTIMIRRKEVFPPVIHLIEKGSCSTVIDYQFNMSLRTRKCINRFRTAFFGFIKALPCCIGFASRFRQIGCSCKSAISAVSWVSRSVLTTQLRLTGQGGFTVEFMGVDISERISKINKARYLCLSKCVDALFSITDTTYGGLPRCIRYSVAFRKISWTP